MDIHKQSVVSDHCVSFLEHRSKFCLANQYTSLSNISDCEINSFMLESKEIFLKSFTNRTTTISQVQSRTSDIKIMKEKKKERCCGM
ncbi:hypothetical protein ENUP19_0018G0058 [Entamoeba nuttalli]|uniref:Uncharacterized protein n=1 Tax=Entamoeba nuttalli TaxID=412467 RepID=A0ABQ0D8P5_9EUKA